MATTAPDTKTIGWVSLLTDEYLIPEGMIEMAKDYFVKNENKPEMVMDSIFHDRKILFFRAIDGVTLPYCTKCYDFLEVKKQSLSLQSRREGVKRAVLGYCMKCALQWQIKKVTL